MFFSFISELKEKMCYFAGASLPGKVTLARGVARVCRFFFSAQLWGLCACNFFRLRYNNGGNFLLFFLKEKKENVSNFPRTFSAGRRCPHSFFLLLFKKKRNIFISAVFMSLFCPVVTCSAPVIWIPVLHPIAAFWFISVSSLLPFLRVFFWLAVVPRCTESSNFGRLILGRILIF